MRTMKLITAEREDARIVRITGDIDHHSAHGLREAIDSYLEAEPMRELILDLSATAFMDSSGLGLILGRLRRAEAKGVRLVLLNPTASIVKILRLAGMEGRPEIRYL